MDVVFLTNVWEKMDRRHTFGYVFLTNEVVISWFTKKQLVTILYSYETKYISVSFSSCQSLWLYSLLKELQCEVQRPMKLMIHNKPAISLTKNPISYGRNKHIEIWFHFIREQVMKGMIEVMYCTTQDQLADEFTKALKVVSFEYLRDQLGLVVI